MFAFGLWDERKQGILLARDPYGIKPLYYADDGWTLRFASQVKALLASGKVSRDPEPAGWVGFGLFGSVPEEMRDAAVMCQELGAQSVDINMGCPVKKVVKIGGGSAMMTELTKTAALVRGMINAVRHLVTVEEVD